MMVKTQNFDLIIIGAGSGLNVIPEGLNVAVVEKGPMGGTCLNRGCIPSKILIHSADIIEEIKKAKDYGIDVKLQKVNLAKITTRASRLVDNDSNNIEKGIRSSDNIKLFKGTGKFIGDRTIKIGNDIIKGNKIIIAAGCRPFITNIEGLGNVRYITSKEALRLTKLPRSMTILGGGYIAVELAHFYGSLGTKVTMIQRSDTLLSREDDEVAEKFTKLFGKKHNILTGQEVKKVWQKGNKIYTLTKDKKGKQRTIVSEQLLVALGLIPNSDILDVKKTGVKVNKNGYIEVNDYLQTSNKNIYALGDIIGTFLLKHTANYESEIVYENAIQENKVKRNYLAMPYAVFSSPQIAGVGLSEEQLKEKNIKYVTGRYDYIKTGMGEALQDKEGFVKVMIDKKTKKILGCRIMGTDAATLIHEVIVAMRNGLTAEQLANTIHIHPALSEVVQRAVINALQKAE